MLVLSRRADQELVFPNLDITIRVLQIKGKIVKLGISAPRDIPILRPEACDEEEMAAFRQNFDAGVSRHEVRNRLNTINLGIRLAQRFLDSDLTTAAEAALSRALEELTQLDQTIGEARSRVRKLEHGQELRLLVVEDDDNERELLAGLLRLHGFNVSTANNGAEAMSQLQQGALPDFVLLDMKMPQVDGPQLISRIRSTEGLEQLQVFAVSGTSPEDLGVRDGCNGWFAKPLDPDALIRAMTKHTSLKSVSV